MSVPLRAALAVVWCASYLAPRSRRPLWRAQWRADLWHYAQWLARGGSHDRGPDARRRLGLKDSLALVGRATGCFPHALSLRFHDWSVRMLSHDLKSAWRMIIRRPAFAAVAVVILGLGIGANATIFSWVESLILQPLPGVDASPLIALHGKTPSRDDLSFSYPNFVDLRAAKPDGIEDMIAFRGVAMNLRGEKDPQRVWGQLVTPNFFDVLRLRPVLGRGFTEAEGSTPGKEPVAVLTHSAWQRLFAGDPAVVGRTITLNARPFTIIGIAPAGFRGTMSGLSLDVFVPLTLQKAFMSGDRLPQRGNSFLQVYARLAPGATPEQAQASLDVAAARLANDHPSNEGRGIVSEPLWRDGAAGLMLPVMAILMAVVGIVLLIACANLAGLLLARAAGRQREVAVRLAVGASRGRLIRQFLFESVLLAVAGGIAGVVLATWTSGLLRLLVPPMPFPVALETAVNLRVVLYAAGVTFVAALAFGLWPAVRASKPDINTVLKDSAAAAGGGAARARMRHALVVVQVALSVLLLVGAALFTRGLSRAHEQDPGFAIRNGALGAIDLLPSGYGPATGAAFHARLLDRVSSLPGVTAATVAVAMPLDISSGSDMSVEVQGYTPADGEDMQAYYNRVGPRYFETMGIDIVSGRPLDERDLEGRPLAVVVNETMARRYWSGGDPVGRTVDFGAGPATVVGVARDGKYGRLNEQPRNYMYVPLAQMFRHDALLIVRTSGDPTSVMPALHATIADLDPNLPLFDVRTVSEHMKLSVFIPRIAGTILGLFGVLAVVLAVVGLYSVVALGVAQRTREIGLRLALGATPGDILRLVLRQGLVLTAVGLAIGLVLAFGAAQAIASQLVGVAPTDVVSFAGTALALGGVALAACVLPALRATRLDPVRALRVD